MSIIPVGIILNILTVVIFLKIKIYKTSTGLQMIFLAASEALLLVGFALTLSWPYRIKNFHVSLCIINNLIVSLQQTYSGLLLTSMTIERYIAVAFPLKVKSLNLKRISKIYIIFLLGLSWVLGAVSAARRIKGGSHGCRNNPNLKELNHFSNTFTYTILGFGLCPILIFIFTVLIGWQLYKQKRTREAMVQEASANESNKEFTITLMLFLVASLFLFTKVAQVITWYLVSNYDRNTLDFQYASVGYYYARILTLLNHSVNSVVYIVFMKAFRNAFLSLFCCRRHDPGHGGNQISHPQNESTNPGSRQETSLSELGQASPRVDSAEKQ